MKWRGTLCNETGFTLTEILVVLVIALILSAIAIPSLTHFWQQTITDNLRTEFHQAIQFARTSAVTYHEKIFLCKSVDQKTCGGEWQNGFIVKSSNHILQTRHFSVVTGKMVARIFPRGREMLEFEPSGWINIDNSTFWYCPQQAKNPVWALIINRTGRSREIFPNAQGEIVDNDGKKLVC